MSVEPWNRAWLAREDYIDDNRYVVFSGKPIKRSNPGYTLFDAPDGCSYWYIKPETLEILRPDLKLEPGGGPLEVKPPDILGQRDALLAAAKTFRIETRGQYGGIGRVAKGGKVAGIRGDMVALGAAIAACGETP